MAPINPLIRKYAHWKAPDNKIYTIYSVRKVEAHQQFNEAASYQQIANIIGSIVKAELFQPAYSENEIDGIFNEQVLKTHRGGVYYSASGNPKETLAKKNSWPDLIINKVGIIIQAVDHMKANEAAGIVPQFIIDDVLPDIELTLKTLKIIEDWIYYNRNFMLRLFRQGNG